MVLWAYGGMYLDVKIVLKEPVSEWVDFHNDTLALVEDVGLRSSTGKKQGYWNAMMAAAPNSWVMGRVIRHVVQNIRKRSYGRENAPEDCMLPTACSSAAPVFGITGPAAFFRAAEDALAEAEKAWGGDESWSHVRQKLQPAVRAATHKWESRDKFGKVNPHSMVQSVTTGTTIASINDDVHRITHQESPAYTELWRKHMVYCNEPGPPC